MAYNKYRVADKHDRTYDGIVFDSKKEMLYARKLDILKHAKEPKNKVIKYERQVNYEMVVNGHKICKYRLDFKVEYADGRTEYIDVKGISLPIYKIKRALMVALHGIQIKEV